MGTGRSGLGKSGGRKGSSSKAANQGKVMETVSERIDFELSQFGGMWDKMTDEEKRALNKYSYTSNDINDYLRDGTGNKKEMERMKKALDSTIDKTTLSQPLVVFRGVGKDYLGMDLSNEDSIKSLVGKTVTDPAFLSTSLSEEVGNVYGRGVVLKIQAPKGKKATFPDLAFEDGDFSKVVDSAKEDDLNHEILFGRNTKLKINGYSKKTNQYGRSYFEISASMR